MAYQDSVAGTALTEAFLDEVNKQLVLTYASAAARTADAALSAALREGMFSYLSDVNQLHFYNGSAWEIVFADGSWTPTLTNVAIGTGGGALNSGTYSYNRGSLTIDIAIVLGTSGASVTGAPSVSLPSGFTLSRVSTSLKSSVGVGLITAATYFGGVATHATSSTLQLLAVNTAGTYEGRTTISSTVPATWVAGDAFFITGTLKGTLA